MNSAEMQEDADRIGVDQAGKRMLESPHKAAMHIR
jgi:hypothetical protein